MNIIFLTDLDGTMLSHDNFSCDSIKNDILTLLESGIIIILNSSKTRKEIKNRTKAVMRCDRLLRTFISIITNI